MIARDLGLTVVPERETIAVGARHAAFVVRIDPPPPPVRRTPVRLVLALDTSGSMAGDKLAAAQASAAALVRALGPDDTFACIGFATRVTTLIAPTAMTAGGKSLAIAHLAHARAGGNTDLAGALLAALALAGEGGAAGRVLLLTDGCPTEGVTDVGQIEALARGARAAATLSTFGFGRDVNPLLLNALAETGRGNYTFIENGEAPTLAIAAELGGILLTVAAGVSLSLRATRGVRIHHVHRVGAALDSARGEATIELPPLVAEEAVYVAFELTWDDAMPESLALATLHARRTSDGGAISAEAYIGARVSPTEGPFVAEGAKELVLARIAVALATAGASTGRPAGEVADALAGELAKLSQAARAAGVDGDPQVAFGLAMIAQAQRGLVASRHLEGRTRQDLVASAASVRGKRNTFMGPLDGDPRSPFLSKSQVSGLRLVTEKKPDEP